MHKQLSNQNKYKHMIKIKITKGIAPGEYAPEELESFVSFLQSEIFASAQKADLVHAEKMHGTGFKYELRKGTQPNLMDLQLGQRVCASQIKGHHILMTQK